LRAQSTGVAQNSQHMYGNAIDIQIPGVDLTTLRNIALRMQIGGVGFYPTSGWPFVHIDTGSVRHWPALSRNELASIFPDGRTLYIPSNGVPLPGYDEAQAAHRARGDQVVALFSVPGTQPPTQLAATPPAQPVVVAAALPPTLIVAPPSPRPNAGVTVTEP